MGAVGGFGVVAEAVDFFRHLFRKYAIRHPRMAFGPHRSGRAEKARAPCHHSLVRRLRLACEHLLPAALDDQSGRRRACGAAIDAARVDVPIAGSVLGMPFAHQSTAHPPRTRLSVRYRPGERSVLSSVLKLWNESRTNRARIADSILSEFVHGDIWWHGLCIPQNRVRGPQSRSRPMLKSINGDARRRNSQDWRGRNGLVPDPIIAF